MKLGTVAIVVPCYNAATTLAATLESALGEAGVNEIVVVDDGSTDCSLAIARSFEPYLRVLTGSNRGVSAARNSGIAATRSEWLLFLDADDVLLPGTVISRLEAAGSHTGDVVITDWEEIIQDGSCAGSVGPRRCIDWVSLNEDAELATATSAWATTAAILYRRELVEKIGGFRIDLPLIEDARFLFDAAFHGARFIRSSHVGARYRILPGSLSRSNLGRFWEYVLYSGRQIEAAWRSRSTINEARRKGLFGIYNNAARGLFAAAHPCYFEAITCLRELGMPLPLHGRLAEPLARVVGLRVARSTLSLVGRS